MAGPVEVFFSYSHVDEKMRDKLAKHLDVLCQSGLIQPWHDRQIEAGSDWDREINAHLDSANIILFLISDDFLASEYCKSVEMKRALQRDREGTARVIPVILRHCQWRSSVVSHLQALPKDGRPIRGGWKTIDEGFSNVVSGIKKVAEGLRAGSQGAVRPPLRQPAPKQVADPNSVDVQSKYARYRISEIVRKQLLESGFNIENLNLDAGMHVRDLEVLCHRLYFPNVSMKVIREAIQKARAEAFTVKYLNAEEDEKLVKPSSLGINGIKPWQNYLKPVLKKVGFNTLKDRAILDVGAGNGKPYAPAYADLKSIEVVDISERAIEKFRANLPYLKVTTHVKAAEYLDSVPNGSIELYLSFRTFQSSLFDRRAALREAFRVLRYGGAVIISIPIMFLRPGRKPLAGLIPPGSKKPNLGYAKRMVEEIKHVLGALNFQKIGVDDSSPFEYFVFANRPS